MRLGRAGIVTAEPPELGRDVRPGTTLTTTSSDGLRERVECTNDRGAVRVPPTSIAFIEPFTWRTVPALSVAPPARGQFVLEPARTALDPRDEMFRRRGHQADVERPAAPDTLGAVAFEDDRHPLPAVELAFGVASTGHAHQNGAMAGRFAPSPTGELHVGNLRTALVAWLAARSDGRAFLVRMEDLDRVTSSIGHEQQQLGDLAAIGLDWDGDVIRQSERFDRYRSEIERLRSAGRVYECYCTRREIRREIEVAASAPHVHLPDGAYPGTCRGLTEAERDERRGQGRRPALRLRTDGEAFTVHDRVAGDFTGAVDDLVLARADGVPAYNLAVVVDDIAQGVTQVVRADDLLSSTPRQVLLHHLLGAEPPDYLHVPLVLGADGERLAKRHGAVTLRELRAEGWAVGDVVGVLARSLGLAAVGESPTPDRLLARFDPDILPRSPAAFGDLVEDSEAGKNPSNEPG